MAEPAGTRTPTAQAAKAAQGSISALLEEIKATEQTNHALGGLSRRLSSAEEKSSITFEWQFGVAKMPVRDSKSLSRSGTFPTTSCTRRTEMTFVYSKA